MEDKNILEDIQEAISSGKFSQSPNKIFVQSNTIADILANALEPAEPYTENQNTNLDGLIIDAIKPIIHSWIHQNGQHLLRSELERQLPKIVHFSLNKLLPGIIKDTLLEIQEVSKLNK